MKLWTLGTDFKWNQTVLGTPEKDSDKSEEARGHPGGESEAEGLISPARSIPGFRGCRGAVSPEQCPLPSLAYLAVCLGRTGHTLIRCLLPPAGADLAG